MSSKIRRATWAWVLGSALVALGSPAWARDPAIISAAKRGDVRAVAAMAKRNPALLGTFKRKTVEYTVIATAAFAGHANVVKYCIRMRAPRTLKTGALVSATRNGHKKICELLIRNGAPLDYRKLFEQTPLEVAITKGQTNLVKLFVARGADVDRYASTGETPIALAAKQGNKKIVQMLLAKDADVNLCLRDDGYTALSAALSLIVRRSGRFESAWDQARISAHEEIALLLLKNGAEPSVRVGDRKKRGALGSAYLRPAAANGYARVVKAILDFGIDVNAASADGRTALHEAALNGHPSICKLLLDKGARVNLKDKQGKTPLHSAVTLVVTRWVKGSGLALQRLPTSIEVRHAIVKLMLAHGADPNAGSKPKSTPLGAAREQYRRLIKTNKQRPAYKKLIELLESGKANSGTK